MSGKFKKAFQVGMAAVLLVPALLASVGTARAEEDEGLILYVSPLGSDSNGGTELAPFATIERARDEIRALKLGDGLPEGGVTVYLREGTYPRAATFELGEQDSGTAASPIVYTAYPEEEVRFTGSATLDGDEFELVTDLDVLDRLPSAVHGYVYEYDLANAGITDYGTIEQFGFHMAEIDPAAELFYEDEPMTLARWPNNGYALTGTVVNAGAEGPPVQGAVFEYADERPESWSDLTDVWMYGYWYWDWADSTMKLGSVDAANNRITTETATYFSIRSGQRYYYFNILEELDSPGEWYLDRQEGLLYFYPTSPLAGGSADLSLLDEPLVSLEDTDYVTFRDLIFENARNKAVVIEGGSYNEIADSVFRNLGNIAVALNGGYRNGVSSSVIYDTGRGGILLNGGDRETLAGGELYAADNEIYEYSRVQATYSPAIELRGTGNRAEHNHIHDAPHLAILVHGNNHVIEYNDIHDVLLETDDAGAIYMGMDWTEQGNVVRYNYLHDLPRIGVYLDDLASGTLVYGNVFADVFMGLLVGGGRDNKVVNNILIDNDSSLLLDDRGLGWQAQACVEGGVLRGKLASVPYDEEPWISRYPLLEPVLTDGPCEPKYNTVRNNVFYRTPDITAAQSAVDTGSIDSNWVTTANPGFLNESAGDYELTGSAAVYTALQAFKPIPFGEIGPRAGGRPDFAELELDGATLYATGSALRVGTDLRFWTIADTEDGTYLDTFGLVAYSSSDTDVAIVDALGFVTGVSVGAATITATVTDGAIVRTDTLELQVMGSLLDKVSLALDVPGASVGNAAEVTVSGTMTGGAPADLDGATIQFESSDDAIAEVDGSGIVTAKGLGYVTITARVTLDSVLRSASILFAVYPSGSGAPDSPWTLSGYGGNTLSTAYELPNGDLSVIGNGADIWGVADAFTYLHQPIAAADPEEATSFTVTVDSFDGIHRDAAAGIMFRAEDTAGSDYAMIRVLPDGGLRMTYRNAGNPGSWFIMGPTVSYPVELKLTREHDWYIGYYKTGGVWTEIGQVQADLGDTPDTGLVVFSHSAAPAEAVFSDVAIDVTEMELTRLQAAADNLRLAVGQTVELDMRGVLGSHYEVELPGTTFAYASSDTDVATVDSAGIVTATGLGEAVIDVTATVNGVPLAGQFEVEVVATRDPYAAFYAGTADALNGGPTVGGGNTVGSTAAGSWAKFANVDFGASAPAQLGLELTVPDELAGGTISVRLDRPDGPEIGLLTVAGTGGWDIYEPQLTGLTNPSLAVGIHDVYFVFSKSGTANVRRVVFSEAVQFSPDGSGTATTGAATTVSAAGDGLGLDPLSFEYSWSESASTPSTGWAAFSLDDTIVKYLAGDGDWYLHVRSADLIGNIVYARTEAFVLEDSVTQFTGLKLLADSGKLGVSQTMALAVTGLAGPYEAELPSTAFTFASSDTGVATVDASGIVTAVGLGTVTIGVTATVNGQPLEGELELQVVTTRDPYAAFYAGTADALNGGPTVGGGNTLGNTAPGAWAKFANLDFGSAEPVSFGLEAAVPAELAGGTISIRLDSPTGPEIGELTIAATDDWDDFELQQTLLTDPEPAVGIHDVYLVFSNYGTCNVRLIVFSEDEVIDLD